LYDKKSERVRELKSWEELTIILSNKLITFMEQAIMPELNDYTIVTMGPIVTL